MAYKISEKTAGIIDKVMSLEAVKKGFDFIEKDQDECLKNQIELAKIEAPTFYEKKRAKAYEEYFIALGLEDVHIDRGGNVVGLLKGTGGGKKVMIEGHLDTVFPFGSVVDIHEKEGVLYGAGIGDDTRALATILSVIRAYKKSGVQTKGDIVFVGTTREEGMGAFGGMKDFLEDNTDIDAVISIDQDTIDAVTYEATGFKTYEINFYGMGGHAFVAFGIANALHAAGRFVAKVADFQVPSSPKTTFCVSNFHAGSDAGVHAIVPKATIKINFRSNSEELLEELDKKVLNAAQEACDEETLRWGKNTITWDKKVFCDVPAGTQSTNSPIVESLYGIIQRLGFTPDFRRGGCMNMNVSIGKNIPSICLGRAILPYKGFELKGHSLDERFPVEYAYKGVQEAFLMTLLCAGIKNETESVLDI